MQEKLAARRTQLLGIKWRGAGNKVQGANEAVAASK